MFDGILLIGLTGAGKTPLGNYIEKYGWQNKKAYHFDFGENLRALCVTHQECSISNDLKPDCLTKHAQTIVTPAETEYLYSLLQEGKLLDEAHNYLIEKVFNFFCMNKNISIPDFTEKKNYYPPPHLTGTKPLIVVNGVPRNVAQISVIDRFITIQSVIYLAADQECIYTRINQNCGGDRAARTDDQLDLVKKKYQFSEKILFPCLMRFGLKAYL